MSDYVLINGHSFMIYKASAHEFTSGFFMVVSINWKILPTFLYLFFLIVDIIVWKLRSVMESMLDESIISKFIIHSLLVHPTVLPSNILSLTPWYFGWCNPIKIPVECSLTWCVNLTTSPTKIYTPNSTLIQWTSGFGQVYHSSNCNHNIADTEKLYNTNEGSF